MNEGVVVVVVITALVLEVGIQHGLNLPRQNGCRLFFGDSDTEPVIGPVYCLHLMVRPEYPKGIYDPGLDLEVVWHRVVLDHAEESLRREYPHHSHPFELSSSENAESRTL